MRAQQERRFWGPISPTLPSVGQSESDPCPLIRTLTQRLCAVRFGARRGLTSQQARSADSFLISAPGRGPFPAAGILPRVDPCPGGGGAVPRPGSQVRFLFHCLAHRGIRSKTMKLVAFK